MGLFSRRPVSPAACQAAAVAQAVAASRTWQWNPHGPVTAVRPGDTVADTSGCSRPMPAPVARACAGRFAYAVSLRCDAAPEASVTAWLFVARWNSDWTWACWAEERVSRDGHLACTGVREWHVSADVTADIGWADQGAYAAACELAETGYVGEYRWDWDGGAF